jgi:glutamate-ammonia-ligase adenylyltransferase
LVVAEAIVDQPELAELILFAAPAPDTILRTVREQLAKAKRDFASDAPQGAASSARVPPEDRREGLVAALRRARHRAVVTIAMLDLADLIETREVTALLSQLADEILDHAVAHELGRENRGLAVIAVGKFGGRELGYGSDLDVFFVFDPACAPPGTEPDEHFARVAQRVIRLISEAHPAGPGYDLDVRLRPSGSHGFLVTSEAAFAAYHGLASTDSGAVPEGGTVSLGAAWERQVLIRARAVAGDRELGARVIRLAGKAAYEGGAPDAPALHHLRCRMQAELAKERVSKKDVKLGRGGLLDVEFLTQWLQMRHGADPRVRGADTERALEALTQAGYLSTNAFETLRQSYAFLRRLEQRLAVLHGKGSSVIDFERPGIAELGRRLGFHDSLEADAATRLRERYLSVTNAVRATYLGVLGLPPES